MSTATPGHRPKGMSRPLEAAPSGSPIGLRGRTFHTGPPAEATSATTRLLYANRSIGSNSVHGFCLAGTCGGVFQLRPIRARPVSVALARPRC